MVLTSYLFVFCFVGTIITTKCQQIAISTYQSMWYNSSIDHQRYIILILARSQKDFYFHGYKLVICSLMNFKSVSMKEYLTDICSCNYDRQFRCSDDRYG